MDRLVEIIEDSRQDLIDLCLEVSNLEDRSGHERPVAERVVGWLKDEGVEAAIQPLSATSANAVGSVGDGRLKRPSLILNGHLDTEGTIPSGGAEVQRALRGAFRDGDLLVGKGLVNCKAHVCAQMLALRALVRSGLKLNGRVTLAATAQETGAPIRVPDDKEGHSAGPHLTEGTGARALLERGVLADYALVGEPNGLSIGGAQAGYLRLRCDVRGQIPYTPFIDRSAGTPNPFERGARVILAIEDWSEHYRSAFRRPFWGGQVVPTAQVQEVRGSGTLFTEPEDLCRIYVDVRVPPDVDPLDVQQDFEAYIARAEVPVATSAYDFRRGYIANGAEPLVDAVTTAHETVFNGVPNTPDPAQVSMWQDMNAFNEAGVSAIAYGLEKSAEPYTIEGTRAVRIDTLLGVSKVYALTAATICGSQ